MQCEAQPTASVNQNAKSQKVSGSLDLPDLVHATRSAVSPHGNQLHHESPSSFNTRTVELHSDGSGCQNDTVQLRSSLPPVVIYPLPPPPPPPPISITELNVPPPPPVTVTSGTPSSLTPVIPRIASLDRLENEQQSLRDLRDKLVGARFSVAAKRKELRDIHIQTSAKDGYIFNLFRQYLNEIGADLPQDIRDALTEASSLRDRLGLLEGGYDEEEARYNTLEWKYSRRETRFVEELLDNKLVPLSDTLDGSRSAEDLEILQLTNFMTPFTNDDPKVSNLAASSDETSARYITEQSAFLAEQDFVTPHDASVKFPQSRSQWSNLGDLALASTQSANDVHPTHKHLRWVEKMTKIDEWLFDIVDTSSSQKLCLKAMHDFGFADTRTWWEHTKWLLVQDYSTYFHTGDSTVFNHAMGQHVSESTKEGPSPVPSVVDSCSTNQLLLGTQPSSVPDTAALPSIVESSNYQEMDSQARLLRKLPSDTGKGTTSSVLMSPSLRRYTSPHKSNVTDSDGSSHHYYYYQKFTRSPSSSDAPGYNESRGGERISWDTVPASSRQRGRLQRPRNRYRLPKRHTMPKSKNMELVEPTGLPKNLNDTSFSPGNIPRPVFIPNSRNYRRRLSSHTNVTIHQYSESEQPSSLVTSNLKLPQSPQTKSSTSKIDRCFVM